jgi:hypothetical protein
MLVNYSQIKARFDAVKPIRGDVHNTKPFINRRRKHEHMVMKDNGDIQIICYDTPVFTVHPDSSFSLCHGGYITPTTSKFISLVVRAMRWYRPGGLYGVYKYKNNLWLRQSDVSHEDVIFPIPKDPMRFVNNESRSVYEPEKVLTHTEQRLRVDKDKSKQARAECKQFLTWLKAMVSVMDGNELQNTPLKSRQEGQIRYLCNYPSVIKKLSGNIPYIVAAEKLKEMLTSDDDAEFLELLHHVADGEVVNKKTVCARTNRIINHVYGAYYIDEVEIKTGTGNT